MEVAISHWSWIVSTVHLVEGGQKATWAAASANPEGSAEIATVLASDARDSVYSGPVYPAYLAALRGSVKRMRWRRHGTGPGRRELT